MNWEFLREEEFKGAIERSGGLCVMPIGCLEKHGQQCPVGTDSLYAQKIVEEAAALEEVVVFPTGMWLGDLCGAHTQKDPIGAKQAGFISLSPETVLTVLEELCDEIARNGFRKILILNAHGGNTPTLAHFLRRQEYKLKPYTTMTARVRTRDINNPTLFYEYVSRHPDEYPMLTDTDLEVLKGWAEKGSFGGGHADFTETACVMGYYPDLVATDRLDAESGLSTHRSDYLSEMNISAVRAWGANFPNAIDGYPAYGVSQTIGQAMNTYCARHLAKMFKVLKEDEECVRIAMKLPPEE